MNLMMNSAFYTVAAVAGGNPIVNTSNFIKEGVQAIALVIVGAIALSYFKQQKFTKLIGFIVTAALILLMIFEPTTLKTFGSYIWHNVFGM